MRGSAVRGLQLWLLSGLLPAFLPAPALAQAVVQFQWTGLWALPIFVGAALLLLGIGYGFAAIKLKALGNVLWLLLVSAGGCLFIFGMPFSLQGKLWHLPAFALGVCLFAVAGEISRRKLED